MMFVFDYLDPLAAAVLEVLINSLWQGALLASLVWCVLRAFRRTNATTRYAFWCVTLAAIFCLPLLASLRGGRVSNVRDANNTTHDRTLHTSSRAPEVGTTADTLHRPAQPGATINDEATGAGAPEQTRAGEFSLTLSLGYWALLCAGLYLLTASWMVSRVAMSYRRLRRLKRESLPLGGAHQRRLEELLSACGIRRAVSVAVSREIAMPLAAGLGAAVILIPRKLLDELTEQEFEQILLHELAHIRRYDDWTNLLQKLAEALFFFHPAVHWVGARLNLEREVACDDWVIWTGGERKPYANCLARLAELVAKPRAASLAPGAATVRKHVFKRVELLLDGQRNSLPRLSRASCAVMLGVLSAGLLQCLRVPTVFAVSAERRAARAVAGTNADAAPASLHNFRVEGVPPREFAPVESEELQQETESATPGATARAASEPLGRAQRKDAGAARESRPQESQAEFDRQLQELMEPKVREAEQQMLEVMQPKIHEVEREVQLLMQPKLDEISRLKGEAARERQSEFQKEVELSMGAKKRELQRQIDRIMQPKVREIEREARQTLLERRRGGAR